MQTPLQEGRCMRLPGAVTSESGTGYAGQRHSNGQPFKVNPPLKTALQHAVWPRKIMVRLGDAAIYPVPRNDVLVSCGPSSGATLKLGRLGDKMGEYGSRVRDRQSRMKELVTNKSRGLRYEVERAIGGGWDKGSMRAQRCSMGDSFNG